MARKLLIYSFVRRSSNARNTRLSGIVAHYFHVNPTPTSKQVVLTVISIVNAHTLNPVSPISYPARYCDNSAPR